MRGPYALKEIDQLIKRAGGTGAVARRFGVKSNAVSNWKRRGLPPETYAAWQEILRELDMAAPPNLWRQRKTMSK